MKVFALILLFGLSALFSGCPNWGAQPAPPPSQYSIYSDQVSDPGYRITVTSSAFVQLWVQYSDEVNIDSTYTIGCPEGCAVNDQDANACRLYVTPQRYQMLVDASLRLLALDVLTATHDTICLSGTAADPQISY